MDAQLSWIEHLPSKQAVEGSNPSAFTKSHSYRVVFLFCIKLVFECSGSKVEDQAKRLDNLNRKKSIFLTPLNWLLNAFNSKSLHFNKDNHDLISLIAEFNFYFVPKKDLFVPIYSRKVILLIFFVQQLIAFTPDQFDLFLRKKKIIRELRYFKIAQVLKILIVKVN